ncbi:MAG: TIGR02186 family protein, partial [Alphaproteobacteria bacterium]
AALILAGAALPAAGARAEQLIVDISQHLVAITTGFTGAEVLLFGVREGDGDIVVVVRGPSGTTAIRRKDRFAGIWVNQDSMVFSRVPAFFHVAATGNLTGMAMEALLERYGLGRDLLEAEPDERGAERIRVVAFREALIRNKQAMDLYVRTIEPVTFVGDRLFRTTIRFPANVPTGRYNVEVYSVTADRIDEMSSTPLLVSRAGFGASVYSFAHDYAAAYGLVAIAVASMAGWAAGTFFRKA